MKVKRWYQRYEIDVNRRKKTVVKLSLQWMQIAKHMCIWKKKLYSSVTYSRCWFERNASYVNSKNNAHPAMLRDRPSTFADGFLRQTNFCKMCKSCLTLGEILLTGDAMTSKKKMLEFLVGTICITPYTNKRNNVKEELSCKKLRQPMFIWLHHCNCSAKTVLIRQKKIAS